MLVVTQEADDELPDVVLGEVHEGIVFDEVVELVDLLLRHSGADFVHVEDALPVCLAYRGDKLVDVAVGLHGERSAVS